MSLLTMDSGNKHVISYKLGTISLFILQVKRPEQREIK